MPAPKYFATIRPERSRTVVWNPWKMSPFLSRPTLTPQSWTTLSTDSFVPVRKTTSRGERWFSFMCCFSFAGVSTSGSNDTARTSGRSFAGRPFPACPRGLDALVDDERTCSGAAREDERDEERAARAVLREREGLRVLREEREVGRRLVLAVEAARVRHAGLPAAGGAAQREGRERKRAVLFTSICRPLRLRAGLPRGPSPPSRCRGGVEIELPVRRDDRGREAVDELLAASSGT